MKLMFRVIFLTIAGSIFLISFIWGYTYFLTYWEDGIMNTLILHMPESVIHHSLFIIALINYIISTFFKEKESEVTGEDG